MLAAAVVRLDSDAAVLPVVAVRLVVLPVLRLAVAEGRAHLAHKLLPLVRLQVAVVLVPLPQEPEVAAALLLVQGLVASESLRSR
jgi:hypothetical protein